MKISLDSRPNLEVEKDVVSHNLKMMEGDMRTLSTGESFEGNAGSVIIEGKRYSCAGLNGYADKQTGKILAFGNPQDVPEEIRRQGIKFTFKEAINLDVSAFLAGLKGKTSKIVDFLGASEFSEKGRKNIEVATRDYNAKHWGL